MLLHDSRRPARLNAEGDLVLLEDQDRGLWDHQQIIEALPLVEEALRQSPGPYALQAAIAAVHCSAPRAEDTDWRQIVRLYDLLARLQPTPVIALNRAAAVSMADALAADGELENYHLLHASRAHPRRRLGLSAEAAQSYRKAPALVTNESERRFLERHLKDVLKLKAES